VRLRRGGISSSRIDERSSPNARFGCCAISAPGARGGSRSCAGVRLLAGRLLKKGHPVGARRVLDICLAPACARASSAHTHDGRRNNAHVAENLRAERCRGRGAGCVNAFGGVPPDQYQQPRGHHRVGPRFRHRQRFTPSTMSSKSRSSLGRRRRSGKGARRTA
jgi:hypothetical protein